jgi:KDO2-lipid IV(A) lauroyltransferase
MKKDINIFRRFGYQIQCFLLDQLAARSLKMRFKTRCRLASLLARLTFDFLKIRRSYVVKTLEERLALEENAATRLARKVYFNFVLNACEMAGLKFMSANELRQKIECRDLANLEQALSRKKGAIIISGHFGLWELVPPWLVQKGFPVTVVVRRQNNPEVDRWMEDMRQRLGPLTTDSGYGMREILKSLRKGHILALMVDQDNGKQGIFVNFLDKWASAPTGPAAISLRTGAPIVPLALFPDYNGRHQLKIWEPIFPENFNDSIEGQQKLTAAYSRFVEEMVRNLPEQWFWLHRRWKTQPADAPENESVKFLNLL